MTREIVNRHHRLARTRAARLWERYHANGGQLTRAEVKEITGQDHTHAYKTFWRWEIKAPPIYDTGEAVARRQAAELWQAATDGKIGRDEACAICGYDKNSVYGLLEKFNRRGLAIPEIIWNKRRSVRVRRQPKGPRQAPTFCGRENIVDSLPPPGLPVGGERRDAEGRRWLMLR